MPGTKPLKRPTLYGWPFVAEKDLFNADAMKRVYAETRLRESLAPSLKHALNGVNSGPEED
jgi:hypothetical protein